MYIIALIHIIYWKVEDSLLDNATNLLGSWVHYPKEKNNIKTYFSCGKGDKTLCEILLDNWLTLSAPPLSNGSNFLIWAFLTGDLCLLLAMW